MDMEEKIGYFYGKPISKMEKEELLKVIKHLSDYQQHLQRQHSRDLDFLSSLMKKKPTFIESLFR